MSDFRDPKTAATLEAEILQQIEDVEEKIRVLRREREILDRMLLKARAQNDLIRRTDVNRKNSVTRVLLENSVLLSLRDATRPKRTSALYDEARMVIGTLRENTFRSTLHRMKNRGLIKAAGFGKWEVGPSQPNKAD